MARAEAQVSRADGQAGDERVAKCRGSWRRPPEPVPLQNSAGFLSPAVSSTRHVRRVSVLIRDAAGVLRRPGPPRHHGPLRGSGYFP